MPSANLQFLLSFWLSFSAVYSGKTQDTYSDGLSPPNGCANCSVCQYPCRLQPPPPPSGSQPYAAPPPPPPAQVNCPPSGPVACCQYSPPAPYYYYPYGNYSGPPISMEQAIKPSASTWLSAAFFISIMIQV